MVFPPFTSLAEFNFVIKGIDTCFNKQREKIKVSSRVPLPVGSNVFSYLEQYHAETNVR